MSEPLKPQFFVLRQNSSIVPLIAMDEVPHNIRVENVPRTMNIKDTTGMTNIGEYPSRHRHHNVIDTNKSSHRFPSTQASDYQSLKSDEESLLSATTEYPVELYSGGPKKSYGIGEQPPSEDESLHLTTTVNAPNNKVTEAFGKFEQLPPWKDQAKLGARSLVPGKKVYCTHWMSTGECDYAQQGCLYKHEMPFDLEILNFLGYQDIPKWYREKHGIGKLTATPGSGAAIAGPGLRSSAMQSAGDWRGGASTANSPRQSNPTPSRGGPGKGHWRGGKSQSRQGRHQPDNTNLPNFNPVPSTTSTQSKNTSPASTNPLHQSKFATSTSAHGQGQGPPARRSATPQYTRGRPNTTDSSVPRVPQPHNSAAFSCTPARPQSSSHFHSTNRNTNTPLPPQSILYPPSRRSSVFSDPEADIIRENDARREKEEREYNALVMASKNMQIGGAFRTQKE